MNEPSKNEPRLTFAADITFPKAQPVAIVDLMELLFKRGWLTPHSPIGVFDPEYVGLSSNTSAIAQVGPEELRDWLTANGQEPCEIGRFTVERSAIDHFDSAAFIFTNDDGVVIRILASKIKFKALHEYCTQTRFQTMVAMLANQVQATPEIQARQFRLRESGISMVVQRVPFIAPKV